MKSCIPWHSGIIAWQRTRPAESSRVAGPMTAIKCAVAMTLPRVQFKHDTLLYLAENRAARRVDAFPLSKGAHS